MNKSVLFDTAIPLPEFDMHNVEAALRANHLLFDGNPLSEKEISEAIEGYRKFLRDHKMRGMPEQFLVPSRRIDRVWHTHMCETKQYAEDMQSYFGMMFHHSAGLCDLHPDQQVPRFAA